MLNIVNLVNRSSDGSRDGQGIMKLATYKLLFKKASRMRMEVEADTAALKWLSETLFSEHSL